MRLTLILTLFALLATLLLAGCPRDTGTETDTGDSSANLEGKKPDFSQDAETPEVDAAAEETDAEATDTEEGEEVVEGDDAEAEGEAVEGEELDADATAGEATTDEEPAVEEEMGADTYSVVFETTKGDFVIEVHPEWAPLGAAHFRELIDAKFYDGAPWFRVIDGFMAQCGVGADPELNKTWSNNTIMDEPVIMGNLPGYVSFGKTRMPNSRSTHIFVNFVDNSRSLDPQGFSAFAKVTEGMDVVNSLHRCQFGDQTGLGKVGGIDLFKRQFPDGDFINKAYIQK